MIFSPWFQRQIKSRRPIKKFRPIVQELEDRTVPSGMIPPGPATHLLVVVPYATQSGNAFNVEVEALDASNHLATGYTGTVGLSASGATLPSPYAFTSQDHGEHTFSVTLTTLGLQTITAADTLTPAISGSAETYVNPAAALTQFLVITPEQATENVGTHVTIEALDQSGNVLTNFTGTITLTSSVAATGSPNHKTAAASLPITYTFTASDHGVHTFETTFDATGTAVTVTAASATLAISGTGTLSVVAPPAKPKPVATSPGPAVSLLVIAPYAPQAGTVNVTVEALDASNQLATGYTGTVTLTDGTTTLGTYTFTSKSHGEHTFSVSLTTPGVQTIKASGVLSTTTISGSTETYVQPVAVLAQLLVRTAEEAAVGASSHVTVEALDQSGHVLTNFTGTITLTSSVATTGTPNHKTTAAELPITYTFTASDHGVHKFTLDYAPSVTPPTTGTLVGVTATSASPSITDTGTANVFAANTVTHFAVVASPATLLGAPTYYVVEALNASNQIVTGYTGTVTFSTSDPLAKGTSGAEKSTTTLLSSLTYTFVAGDHGKHVFWFTFGTAGNQTVTVTDATTYPGITLTGVDHIYVAKTKFFLPK